MSSSILKSKIFPEAALVASYLPIAIYALGLRIQNGLVSAFCDKSAAPAVFTGGINDLKSIWSIGYSDLFGTLDPSDHPHVVVSLRHGNSFPLVNKAILTASGCLERQNPSKTDLQIPRPTTVNIFFLMPKTQSGRSTFLPPKLIGGAIATLEIAVHISLAVLQGLNGVHLGSALAGCLACSTLCYLILQQFEEPVFAHKDAIEKDRRITTKNGAATDIHVIVSDWNASEMNVLLGYSSQLHSLTNIPARTTRPNLLRWICRMLGVILVVQAALLTKLVRAPVPALYGSSIWLLSCLGIYVIRSLCARFFRHVKLCDDVTELVAAPQLNLPGRRAALAFISSLPISKPRADPWDWVDGFMPRNARREEWQKEMEKAKLSSKNFANVNLSDDAWRNVIQVRRLRFESELMRLISQYEKSFGMSTVEGGDLERS